MYRYCVFSLSLAVSLSHTLTNMQNTSLWTGLNWPVSIFSLCFNAWTATGDKSGTLHHAPSVVSWQVICSDVALTPHDLPTKQTQQRWRWCLTLRAFGIKDFIRKHVWIPPVQSATVAYSLLSVTSWHKHYLCFLHPSPAAHYST